MALTQLLKSGASNHYSHLRACIVSQLGQRSFGMLKDKLEPQSTNWPLTTCSRVHQKSPSSTPPNLSNWCTNIRRPSSLAQLPLPPVFFKQDSGSQGDGKHCELLTYNSPWFFRLCHQLSAQNAKKNKTKKNKPKKPFKGKIFSAPWNDILRYKDVLTWVQPHGKIFKLHWDFTFHISK